MATWTKRTEPSSASSPIIDTLTDVINTASYKDEIIDLYRPDDIWSQRNEPTAGWEILGGLWVNNYYPWKSASYPWLRGEPITNWTERTQP